ncbi:MAG: DUF3352 domain-containing protein [Bacteroidota bacterium]
MTKKRILLGLLALLVLYLCYLAYIFILSPKTNLQSIYLIPEDAVFIIESEKPVDSWAKVSESEAWRHLQKNDYFAQLTENIQKVDTVFNNNHKLFEFFDGRSLFISIHMVSKKDYGIFYVLDLKRIAKLKLLKTYLNTLLNDNYTMSKRTYHEHEILEVFDRIHKETLYLAFIKNQLVASYTHTLVEASLDQYSEPKLGRNLDFLEINSRVGLEDLFRVYLQYDFLDEYYARFSDQQNEWLDRASKNFLFSGFHIDLDEKSTITADGYTNISSTNHTYLKALQKSGRAKRSIPEIAPARTALYISYGFDSFPTFYENFEAIQQSNPEQFEGYKSGIEKVEKFLKINVKENFVDWIGEEIALLQINTGISKKKNDLALVLKTKDSVEAKRNLDFVLKQIKKKTPVKFKAVDYKDHEINFLSIKGFFKILLGNRFKEFDKPYFTQVADYVIFSNNPNTLKGIIDDFLKGNTMEQSKDFRDFDAKFQNKSSLFLYSNVPLLYENMRSMADSKTQRQLKKNRNFIVCFSKMGLQLSPNEDLFESRMVVNYQDVGDLEPFSTAPSTKRPTQQPKGITESVFDLKSIYPSDLNAKSFSKKYANGNVRFEVDLKNGLKHGKYLEYHPNGVKKITGRYRKDEQIGTWRYYDSLGELKLKKKF